MGRIKKQGMMILRKLLVVFEIILGLEGLKIGNIACGSNHSIFISEDGRAYGCGNNSFLQLSHSEEYDKFSEPLMVSFDPLPLNKGIIHFTEDLRTTE